MSSLNVYREDRARRRIRLQYFAETKQSLFETKLRKAVFAPIKRLSNCLDQLDSLSSVVDTEQQPTQWALDRARELLHRLEIDGLDPVKITSAADGGVAICFANREKYSDIEFLNSGDVLGVISNRRDHPIVWEIEPSPSGFAQALARIRDFLAPSEAHDPGGAPGR